MKNLSKIIICLVLAVSAASAQAVDLQYATLGKISGDKALVHYESPEGDSTYRCSTVSGDCMATTETTLDPAPFDGSGTYYYSRGNAYAVKETALSIPGWFVYRVYQRTGNQWSEIGMVPLFEEAVRLRFSSDEKRLVLITRSGELLSVKTDDTNDIVRGQVDMNNFENWQLDREGFAVIGYSPQFYFDDIKSATALHYYNFEYDRYDMIPVSEKVGASFGATGIYYIDRHDGFMELHRYDTRSGSSEVVTKGAWVKSVFEADGGIFFIANAKEDPYTYNLYSDYGNHGLGGFKRVYEPFLEYANISPDTSVVVDKENIFLNQQKGATNNVIVYNTDNDVVTPLVPVAYSYEPKGVEERLVDLPGGGKGIYMTGSDRSPDKVMVWLHGGPHRQTSFGYNGSYVYAVYDELLHALAREGWGVLKIDYAGSTGHTVGLYTDVVGNIGKKDVENVEAGIDWINSELRSPEIGLMGISYGGYLALKTSVENPGKVDHAISLNGVIDWTIDSHFDDGFHQYFGGRPDDNNQQPYIDSAIFPHLENLEEVKTLLVQSEFDTAVDPVQAYTMSEIVKFQYPKVDLGYVVIPGAEHTLETRVELDQFCDAVAERLGERGLCASR